MKISIVQIFSRHDVVMKTSIRKLGSSRKLQNAKNGFSTWCQHRTQKPHVVIIKDIYVTEEGAVMFTGQWFYRQEEAKTLGGRNWPSYNGRELFYSFHREEFPAESVLHKCVVHFILAKKRIPPRKQHPGFIVQKVYDTETRRLSELTSKGYGDDYDKRHELKLLVEKTLKRIGDLPDLVLEDASVGQKIK